MADLKKTIEVVFDGTDASFGSTLDNLGSSVDSFQNRIGSLTGPLASATESLVATEAAVIGLATAYGVYAVAKANEFESAQINLAKVLQDGDGDVSDYTDTVITLSEKYGETAANVLNGIATFKQAGYTAKEAATLQDQALQLMIAGDVAASDAVGILISQLKGFDAKADESGRFIEALNNVSNEYATDLGELANGMARLSPVASQMGFSFEESTGLLTPIIEVYRSGSEAANALRTGLLKLVDDSKPVAEALASIGVSQTDLNGNLRSGKDIFYDVAAAFQNLDENQKLFVTSQLVGIEQSGKMVKVFDDLGKVQEITAVALEKTGSVQDEVNKRLASGEVLLNKTLVTFENIAISIGSKLQPGLKAAGEGVNEVFKAFRELIDSGGLDPLLNSVRDQGTLLKDFLISVAKALPDAFKELNYAEIIAAFENLKGSVGALFGDLDLTNAKDLAVVLQRLIDFVALLTNATAGVVQGFAPFVEQLVSFLQYLADSESDTQTFIGQIGGIASGIDKLLPLVGLLGDGLTTLGGALAVLSGAKMLTGINNMQALSGILANATPYTIAFAGAAASVAFAIDANTKAYADYQQRQQAVAETEDELNDLHAQQKTKLEEISKQTGLNITSMDAFNYALDNGIIKLDEANGGYKSGVVALRDFDAEVEAAAANSETWADSIASVSPLLKEIGVSVTGYGNGISEATRQQEINNAVIADAEKKGLSYASVVKDGVVTIKTWGGAVEDTAATVDAAARALDKLTEREKLLLAQTHETELKLLELASNETIKSMEFTADIRIADIEAQAEQVVAAFDSIQAAVVATQAAAADIFGSLASAFGDENISGFDKATLEDLARKQLEQSQQALDDQSKLVDAQVRNLDARTEALLSGSGFITVTADSLEPALQLVLRSLVEQIQIQANAEGLELLL